MVIIALLIGAILIVAGVRNSQTTLFQALGEDVPAFVVWAAAIVAIGVIGFIPGLKPVSRGILFLVIVVLVLKNYKAVIAGFENSWNNPGTASSGTTAVVGALPANAPSGLAALGGLSWDDFLSGYKAKYGSLPSMSVLQDFYKSLTDNSRYDPTFHGTGSLAGSGIPGM